MKPLFVLGCPRSGTTMLQQALNRHSRIVIPPETKFFYWFYGQPFRVQKKHIQRIERDLRIALPPLKRKCRTQSDARAYFQQLAELYVNRLQRNDVEYFGDKTPEHTSQIEVIRDVFPDARFICLYRDGRDVALSLTRVPWIRCNVYGGFAIWRHYSRILRGATRESSQDVLNVKYEDLAMQPDIELRRISEFLGLEYEDNMSRGYGNSEGIPQRELSWKGRALEPITTERIGVWRRELTATQIQDLEWLGREDLAAWGYSLRTAAARPASRFLRARIGLELVRCAWQLPWATLRNEVRGLLLSRRGQMVRQDNRESSVEEVSCPIDSRLHVKVSR